ncbi:hypothetical protein V493_01694 [Pseudogymnoascus sp. VKM F-4281 (FW-2241)]|nr:hypothetical protein V493_01694 [Pseudogymnoascus sp. VKM F-4281 (FW-2241)]
MSFTIVGLGGSSIVTATTDGQSVWKGYEVWIRGKRCASRDECEDLLAKEARIYQRLGQHANILWCDGLVEVHLGVHSLQLERALHGNVREFIEKNKTNPPHEMERLKMSIAVSRGIAHAHSKDITHGDLSCCNLLLFPGWFVKVGDFGSASVVGVTSKDDFVEEIRYELPLRGRNFEDRPRIKRDLFALGSAMYEIMTWGKPFEDLGTDDIENKYSAEEFPDVTHLSTGDIIRRCWDEDFPRAEDVADALCDLQQQPTIPQSLPMIVYGTSAAPVYLYINFCLRVCSNQLL